MNKVDKIKVDKLIHKIGLKYNLPDSVIREIVESQFKFTAEKLHQIDFDKLKTEEDIESLKHVFIYKTFGKLYINQLGLINFLKKRNNGRSNKS